MLARRLLRAVGGAFVSHSAGVGRQARDHAAVRPLPFSPRLPRCGGSARQPLSRLFATTGDGLPDLPDPLALTEKRLDAAKAEIGQLTEAIKAQAIELAVIRGKSGWG